MMETEMGYRGSKSSLLVELNNLSHIVPYVNTRVLVPYVPSKALVPYVSKVSLTSIAVKEQRVDGSWGVKTYHLSSNPLRCTLMGFERNYPIKIPTNQLMTLQFSTSSGLNPWFITGFSDAEGSFIISIYKSDTSKLKWRVTAYFSIHIHIKDIAILESVKNSFGVGNVRKNSNTTALFRVDNVKELQIIIDHFDKYPLIGAKLSDYILFKQCFELIKAKQHLTKKGLEKIVSLKYNINKGLTKELVKAFPSAQPVDRPDYTCNGIKNPFWLAGFASGDSSFYVSIENAKNSKQDKTNKTRVRLGFGTNLHIRDKQLLVAIANYLTILPLHIYEGKSQQSAVLQIRSYSQIVSKVIPFFNEYPIIGVKSLDFADFKKVAELVKDKEHLTKSGFKKILNIVEGMNLRRENS